MASVDSLTFDLTDCKLVRHAETERIWVNADRVAHRLTFDQGVIYWPFDLTDPNAAQVFYRQECEQNRGVMLEMYPAPIAGVEGLAGVFKYRSPAPGSRGMAYIGILWLPFQDCRFQVNVEAVEQGNTGMREAAVMVIEGDKWPMDPQAEIPVINNQEELDAMHAKALGRPLRRLPSDDAKCDASFPQHPLSLVRAGLARVIATAQLAPDARGLLPHRISR
ncbi:hypothetical protein [Lacipirellula limnantheis]|uniref:Uncharacterized protein n=1 Tax=Lacipirellula limnantheis TaxID=2528024 RepID=A0A517TS99_9BACT|nr:hypothetical protein [Lacipirellula limnantheis]QDT71241.1 hypothetical protein I41_03970 [Lacipirellula limnantheis]